MRQIVNIFGLKRLKQQNLLGLSDGKAFSD